MRKQVVLLLTMLLMSFGFQGCVSPSTIDAGEEGVLIYQPWIFGTGGVDPKPITTGLTWTVWSTDVVRYDTKALQYTENFTDLITDDNNAVDFNSYIELEIVDGASPELHEDFGEYWYKIKIKETYRTFVRNGGRKYSMAQLVGDESITKQLAANVKALTIDYIKELGMDHLIQVNRVNIGKVKPPAEVLEETDRTAVQKQRIKTEAARAQAELSREDAERNKAIADKAYKEKFGMTNAQYLHLRELELEKEKIEMVKNKNNVNVDLVSISGNAVPTYDLSK